MAFFDNINNIIFLVLGIVGVIILILLIAAINQSAKEVKLRKKAKSLGFSSIKEMRELQEQGYETKEEYDKIMSLGFRDKEEFLYAEDIGATSKENLYEKLNQNIQDFINSMDDYKTQIEKMSEEIPLIISLEKMRNYVEMYENLQKEYYSKRDEIHRYPKEKVLDADLIKIPENIKDLENSTASQFLSLKTIVEERLNYVTERNKILELLNQFRPNVPVQLDRIGEITNLPIEEVISFLKDIVEVDPEIGEYLELEQVFIRKTETTIQIDKLFEQFQEWEQKGVGKRE
ncbi:MAG: hypothetical protein ACTSX6_07705 [Candidatus Heimdallarchaeaceae archaeon]